MPTVSDVRIGIDFGGTKIEAAVITAEGDILQRRRVPTPADYEEALASMVKLVLAAEAGRSQPASVGMGVPGRIDPGTGIVRNANCLNGHTVQRDLSVA